MAAMIPFVCGKITLMGGGSASFAYRADRRGRGMENISTDLASELGISASHSRMDNGELRYRLVAKDGSSYIRTEASGDGGWQNSHYHKSVSETYIVQDKWLAFAERDGDDMRLWIMQAGDIYTTRIGVSHNVYLPPHAVLHTIKHGEGGEGGDWYSDPVLDSLTKHLSEAEIRARAAVEARGASIRLALIPRSPDTAVRRSPPDYRH